MTDRTELILLVVSDSLLRTVLREILLRPGYVVVDEGELGGAVDRLSEVTPDLLIIRPHIGNMTGHEAALYLRKKVPGLPVLMVTGYPNDDRLTNRESVEGIDLFPNPFNQEDLLAKVAEVMAAHPRRVRNRQ